MMSWASSTISPTGCAAQWLWELGNQLAGTATVSRTQRLEDLAESTTKEMIIADRFDVSGAYRFHPDWRLTGGIGGSRVENDEPRSRHHEGPRHARRYCLRIAARQ